MQKAWIKIRRFVPPVEMHQPKKGSISTNAERAVAPSGSRKSNLVNVMVTPTVVHSIQSAKATLPRCARGKRPKNTLVAKATDSYQYSHANRRLLRPLVVGVAFLRLYCFARSQIRRFLVGIFGHAPSTSAAFGNFMSARLVWFASITGLAGRDTRASSPKRQW